jgi:hypothetical protein
MAKSAAASAARALAVALGLTGAGPDVHDVATPAATRAASMALTPARLLPYTMILSR